MTPYAEQAEQARVKLNALKITHAMPQVIKAQERLIEALDTLARVEEYADYLCKYGHRAIGKGLLNALEGK